MCVCVCGGGVGRLRSPLHKSWISFEDTGALVTPLVSDRLAPSITGSRAQNVGLDDPEGPLTLEGVRMRAAKLAVVDVESPLHKWLGGLLVPLRVLCHVHIPLGGTLAAR